MHGILVRPRAQIINEDEKPSNFFCNLKKYHYSSKIITSKPDMDDGKSVTDQFEILKKPKNIL